MPKNMEHRSSPSSFGSFINLRQSHYDGYFRRFKWLLLKHPKTLSFDLHSQNPIDIKRRFDTKKNCLLAIVCCLVSRGYSQPNNFGQCWTTPAHSCLFGWKTFVAVRFMLGSQIQNLKEICAPVCCSRWMDERSIYESINTLYTSIIFHTYK